MSENPPQDTTNTDPSQGKSSINAAEQVAKTPMIYMDPMYNQWLLIPQFRQQFEMMLGVIEDLKEIVNQKWTAE